MAEQSRLIAGVMSGTSADGVDVAIARINGTGLAMGAELIRHHHRPYSSSLKQAIFALRASGQFPLEQLARLGREISLAHAACVNEALALTGLNAGAIAAIAAHGQTLFHQPPDTIQWLDPALLAFETGCRVISDFRRADCAAGGQGAPLVPFADYLLFRHATKHRFLLNIGGIANVTYIPPGAAIDRIIAFDTGPGNCISDHLCRQLDPSGVGFDAGGRLAESGEADFRAAFVFSRSEYAFRKPPKSTDGPEMLSQFGQITSRIAAHGTLADQLATACLATVLCIQTSLDLFIKGWRQWAEAEILVSGGGVHNTCLMKMLREQMSLGAILAVETLDPTLSQAKEAVAFALLGAAALDGFPANVPSCTGAKRPVVLGTITPAP